MDVETLNVVLDAKLAPLQRQLARADREVAKARASMQRLEKTTLSSTAGMSSGFRRASGDVNRFGRQLDRTSRGILAGSGAMRSLTRSLAFASTAFLGGAGLGAALRYTIGQAGSFESELNTLQAVTRATGAQMRVVSTLAKRLGADIKIPGASAADAAEAMTELAKGGLSLRQAMRAAKGTLQLAAAAQLSNAEAAKISVSALNAFRLSGSKATKIADLLAAAANASQGSISDMALALQQAAAQAHASGLTAQETVTALTLLAKAGIQGSDAGTSLRVMLQRFIPQGARAARLMRDLGLSAFDAKGNMLPLRDIIDRYQKVLVDLNPKQRAFVLQTIFGADATRAANIILAQGVREYDKVAKATGRQGEAARVAGAKTKGWEGAVQRAQNAVETLAITVGEKLLPHLTPLLTRFGNWVARLAESEEMQRKLNEKIEASIGFAKRAAIQLENLAKAVDKVARAVGGWEEAFKLILAGLIAKKLLGVLGALGVVGGKGGILGSLNAIKKLGPVLGLTIAVKAVAEGDVSAWEAMLAGGLIGSRFGPVGAVAGAVILPVIAAGERSKGTPGFNTQQMTRKRAIDAQYTAGRITRKQRDALYRKYGIDKLATVAGERGGIGADDIQSGRNVRLSGDLDANAGVLDFARVVGATAGEGALQISSGFRTRAENTAAKGAPRSDHLTGNAVDISAAGARLTRLGQAALIAAGMPVAQARRIRSFFDTYNGYFIAFNVKGHFDHLHISKRDGQPVPMPQPGADDTLTGGESGAGGLVDAAIDKQLGSKPKKLSAAEKLKAAVDKARAAVSPKIAESVSKLNDLAVNGLLPEPLVKKLEARAANLKKALKQADTKAEVAAAARGAAGLNKAIEGAVKQIDIVAAFRERMQAAKGEIAGRLQELLGDPIRQVTPGALAKARELAMKIERQLTTTLLSDAARQKLQAQLQAQERTIVRALSGMLAAAERAQGKFESAWARIATRAMKAFDTATQKGLREIQARFAGKTPARLALEQLEREQEEAAARLAESEAAQELADALAGGDAAEIARAQQRLADLAFERRRRELEALALLEEAEQDRRREQEIDAYERMREEQRDQLETQLADWKEQIMSGGTVAIGEIEQKLGPLAAAAGEVLGVGFTDAWKEGFQELRKLWDDFIRDLNKARVEVGLKPLTIGDSGGRARGGGSGGGRGFLPMAQGGEFIATGPTPMLVGEGYRREHVKVTPLRAGAGGDGEPVVIQLEGDIYLDEVKVGRQTRRWLLRNGELVGTRGTV